jgi:hypothetical protein
MSWNANFILVRRDYTKDVYALAQELQLSLGVAVRPVSFDEATSSFAPGKSIGYIAPWTLICDPESFMDQAEISPPIDDMILTPPVDEGLCNVSKSSLALALIMSGVADIYAMAVYRNGVRERYRVYQEGEITVDIGAPSPEEISAFSATFDEEERVFTLLDRFGLPFSALEAGSFILYARR